MFHSIKSGFPNCSIFKETCKDHEFIPSGKNIVMNCVSGGALNIYLSDKKEDVWSIQYIMHGSLYACSCDEEWYFGVANCFSVENFDVTIKFLQINGPATQFFRPSLEDTCWIPIHDIITKVDPSSFGSS